MVFPRSSGAHPRRTLLILVGLIGSAFLVYHWFISRAPISELERATVHIQRVDADGEQLAFGSGTIIREDGLILTNAHVADPTAPGLALHYGRREAPAHDLVVSLFAGNEDEPAEPTYRAKVIASDGYLDVAVLQIDRTIDGRRVDPASLDLQTVILGDSDRLRIDDELRILGYPEVGGGRIGTINVVPGNISGFLQDPRIDPPRGWIKTSASIYQGNSGGLATDKRGRLIGLPTRVGLEFTNAQSDSNGTVTGDISGTQGRIRPINLLKSLVRAAEAGMKWTSPYLVKGTNKETVTSLGWANEVVEGSCPSSTRGEHFPSGAQTLVAVFDLGGMTENEDVQLHWRYQAKEDNKPEKVVTVALAWNPDFGASFECFWAKAPALLGEHGTFPDGHYILEIRVGPTLHLIGREETTVGIATGPEAGDPNEFPNSDEETILATLPPNLRESCRREANEDLFAAASAGVRCDLNGITAYYYLFRSRDALDDEYWALFENEVEPQGKKGDNGCVQSAVGEGIYTVEKSVAGRVQCFRDDEGNAVVAWKSDGPLILGYAIGDETEPLWSWWLRSGAGG